MEKNLATGEETRISQRGQDFEMGKKSPETGRTLAPPARDGAQSPARPMEAVRPTARSYEATSHEAPAGPKPRPKQAGFSTQNDTSEADFAALHETPPNAGAARHSPENPQFQHQNGTASAAKGRLQFTADEVPPDNKISKLQAKSDKTAAMLDKARGKFPAKKRIKTQRVYDEAKAKAKTKLQIEKEVIPQGGKRPSLPARAGKMAGRGVTRAGANKLHQKISEVENENVGVKATHKVEQTAENSYRGGRTVRSAYRFVKERPYRRVAKLERQATKANIKLDYRKALNENPKLKSNVLSRMMQKQKIKREYAKAAREAQKAAGKVAKKTSEKVAAAARAVVHAIKSHPAVVATIGALAFLVIIIMTSVSSCSNMAMGGMGTIMASSYLAEDTDIDNAELIYTEWETDLLLQVNNAESDHPGFDEYRYNVGDIGHDPYELMAFLTAAYQNFTYDEVQAVLRQMFEEQYQLSFAPEIEIRTRTVTKTDPATGLDYEEEEEYEWHILNINLAARSFTDIAAPRLTSDEREIYDILMQTKGNRQYAYSPFDFNWLPYVSCYYGWRVHPITGEKDNHKAVDIAVAEGTEIIAAHDGAVVTATNDSSYGYYLAIDDGEGLVTKYAHCSQLLVSPGQQVTQGDVIAKVGSTGVSTGPHLHFEVIYNGQYLNPLYFAVTNDDGSGRIPPGSPGGPEYAAYPGEPITDAAYAAMIAEAEKHLGKRYVFGASGPANFDCSGFVSWVLDKSGVKPMGRTNAQGIYNMCSPVSPSEAKPGDLIFFSGTYSTPNVVSHIGIYVGNGMMLHCGDPIQYTSINTSYWQDHFYAFARIN